MPVAAQSPQIFVWLKFLYSFKTRSFLTDTFLISLSSLFHICQLAVIVKRSSNPHFHLHSYSEVSNGHRKCNFNQKKEFFLLLLRCQLKLGIFVGEDKSIAHISLRLIPASSICPPTGHWLSTQSNTAPFTSGRVRFQTRAFVWSKTLYLQPK